MIHETRAVVVASINAYQDSVNVSCWGLIVMLIVSLIRVVVYQKGAEIHREELSSTLKELKDIFPILYSSQGSANAQNLSWTLKTKRY